MRARGMCLVGLLFLAAFQLLSLHTPPARAFDPATGILWETGAESGTIGDRPKPPFDFAGPMGDGSRTGSYVVVTDEQVRTGAKAMKLYQVPPTKSDAQRRVTMRQWTYTKNELYASWWVCFPNNMEYAGGSGQWTNIGGLSMRYGPSDWEHKYVSGVGIYAGAGSPRNLYAKSGEVYNGPAHYYKSHFYLDSAHLNKWLQFQIYVKLGKNSDGIHRAWIGDGTTTQLVLEETGITNDPRGYSRWNSGDLEFAYPHSQYLNVELYQERNSPERWYYVDDVVLSDTKVPESYGVGYQSLKFVSWEDGFESGDFSAWNGTQYANGGYKPTVTSTYAYRGSYSANLTIDGTINSYSRPMHEFTDVSEVYMRSYVRFEDLPDTNDSVLWFHRMAQSDGTFIAAAGVHKVNANYYWMIYHSDLVMNETQATINADTWYGVEFYFDATTNSHATLWVYDGIETRMCEMSGDFSSYGSIGIVYPYIYAGGWNGSQQTSKTLFHDDFAVDDKRIGFGAPTTFQTSTFILTGVEDEPVRFSTLEGVRINGTRSTNASGCYEWANLAYNKVYTFVIEKPAGYYPAWVLNVEGSYSWNGTHYILRHNVTEKQSGPIEICFSPTEEVYIKSSTHKLTSVFYNDSSKNPHTFMRFNITADIGVTSRLEIYTADEGHPRPYKIEGATDWSYDSESKILTVWILHTGEEDAEIEWRGAAMGQ